MLAERAVDGLGAALLERRLLGLRTLRLFLGLFERLRPLLLLFEALGDEPLVLRWVLVGVVVQLAVLADHMRGDEPLELLLKLARLLGTLQRPLVDVLHA